MLSPLPGWIVYDEVDLYAQPTVHDGYIYVYYTAPPLGGLLGIVYDAGSIHRESAGGGPEAATPD